MGASTLSEHLLHDSSSWHPVLLLSSVHVYLPNPLSYSIFHLFTQCLSFSSPFGSGGTQRSKKGRKSNVCPRAINLTKFQRLFYCTFVPFSPPNISKFIYSVFLCFFFFFVSHSLLPIQITENCIFSYPLRVTFHYLSSRFICWDEGKDEARKEEMGQILKVLSCQATEYDFYLQDNNLC